jgi:hypothetical protein
MENKAESIKWGSTFRLSKYYQDIIPFRGNESEFFRLYKPFEIIDGKENCLLDIGKAYIWLRVIGSAREIDANAFTHTNSTIGVGDSTTPASSDQLDLQASSNKKYNAMDLTYPLFSDTTPNVLKFQSSFGSTEANFAWQEWVIKNTAWLQTVLNRRVVSLGTKTAGPTWTLNVTLTIT